MMPENIYRYKLRECLKILSLGSEMLEYERNVPIAWIPAEVGCWFFDDFYHPKSLDFMQVFSEEELL